MLEKARAFRDANTRRADTYDELKQIVDEQGGFVRCFFKPDRATEAKIKEETKATVRCIPLRSVGAVGALHLHGRGDRHRSAVRGRVLRCGALALVTLLAAGGCVSDAAARRVRIVGARPPCPVVDARLRGRGDNVDGGDARSAPARRARGHHATSSSPTGRAATASQVVDAIGYACTGPTAHSGRP